MSRIRFLKFISNNQNEEIEKKIREFIQQVSIDSFTDKSKLKERRTFSREELQRVSDCLDLEDDKRYIEQTELYLKGIRDGYALKIICAE